MAHRDRGRGAVAGVIACSVAPWTRPSVCAPPDRSRPLPLRLPLRPGNNRQSIADPATVGGACGRRFRSRSSIRLMRASRLGSASSSALALPQAVEKPAPFPVHGNPAVRQRALRTRVGQGRGDLVQRIEGCVQHPPVGVVHQNKGFRRAGHACIYAHPALVGYRNLATLAKIPARSSRAALFQAGQGR